MKIDKFFLITFTTLLIYSIVLFFYYEKSQDNAIDQAKTAAKEILRNKKATKEFFYNDQQKGLKSIKEDSASLKFLPELYSCAYASQTINNYYNQLRAKDGLPQVRVHFASSNPKNPDNMALEKEKEILNKFNRGTITSFSKIIEEKNKQYLYYAKPTVKLNKSCLLCHGNPKDAPMPLIKMYGDENGFYNKEGDIPAFIKILMPLDSYLNAAKNLFLLISISTFVMLIFIFILVRIFINKSKKDLKKFQIVIDNLDELIIVKSNEEILSLNKAFMKFFQVKSLKEFKKQNFDINKYIIKSKESLDLDLRTINNKLLEKIKNTEKIKRVVNIANNNGDISTFTIKIDRLEDDENLYVIVLSDVTKLQQRAEKFKKRANTDSLTEIFSRQKFDQLYELEFARSIRYFNPLTILFIDIDHFKEVNDAYGHDIGDLTLKTFAKIISNNIRECDIFARWGGEEFILMLPQTNVNDGYKLAEKIRLAIQAHKFEEIKKITCSIGLSMLNKGDSYQQLIKRADTALYKAKKSGRNRTIIEI